MLPWVPSSVPVQCTIASMTFVTLIQQLISSFGTTFSSTAVIPVHQFFSSDMVSPAVCPRFVSLLDPYDIHSGFLCIIQVSLFGPHSYVYVSWYEHGYARLFHILRFFLIQNLRPCICQVPMFWTPLLLLCYILIREWECLPRPYDQMIPHPLLRLCTFSSCSWFGIVVPGFRLFLLFSTPQEHHTWLMMSIGHTMSSCPRTSGGNLLTPKKCSLPHLPHYMAHLSIFLPYFP